MAETHMTNGCGCKIANDDTLRAHLANDDVVYSATQIFDALSDSTRFQILGVLVLGDGQRMIYSLADEHVEQLLRVGLSHAAEDARPE